MSNITYIFHEILAGFNPDVILANKPSAYLSGINLDLEKERGTIRKRKGYTRFRDQIVASKDILGLFDFIKNDGTRVPLAVIEDSVAVSNAAYADPVVTLTVASGHGIVVGDEIVVSDLAPAGYNGTFTVTEVAATSIKYEVASLGALTDTTGAVNFSQIMYDSSGWTESDQKGLTVDAKARFENFIGYCFFTNGNQLKTSADGITWGTTNLLNTVDISAVVYADPVVTLTVPGGHGVEVGDSITVSGLAPAGYNGTFTVTAVTATTIAYSVASLGAVTDEEGSLTVQFALAANDIVEYSNFLFLIGLNGYESDIMWSKLPTKTDFSSGYTINWARTNNVSVRLGDGEELIAGVKNRGALYLFKNNSISRTFAPVEVNGIQNLSDNVGAASRGCIQVVNGQLVFFCNGNRNAKKGVYSYNSLSDLEPQLISEPIQPIIDGMTAGHVPVAGVINDLYVIYLGAISNEEFALNISNAFGVFDSKTNRWLGVWSLATPAKVMSLIVQSNVTNLYMGDNDGKVWKLNDGGEDAYEDGAGKAIEMQLTSHSLDIGKQNNLRRTYRRNSVSNIWIYGDNLNGVNFRYRFDKKTNEKGDWREAKEMLGPVYNIPVNGAKAHLWQFEISQIGRKINQPVIRKVVIDYD